MLGKKSRRTDAIWRDQVLWIPGKTWWWGPDRGFRANFKANDNHCTWRGQIIRISLPLVCFLRQNLQKTAEVFLTHNQICLKLACCAGWVAPSSLLSFNQCAFGQYRIFRCFFDFFFNLLALISIFYCYFQASSVYWADCILIALNFDRVLLKQRHLWILWKHKQ